MKNWAFLLSVLLLSACNAVSTGQTEQKAEARSKASQPSDLPDLGKAPELTNVVWLNTPEPLRLADLQGKIVLIEMWTFG